MHTTLFLKVLETVFFSNRGNYFNNVYRDEPEKRHVFAARAEDNVVQWVMKLRESSYEYLRNRLHTLQSKIYAITGKVLICA